MTLRGCPFAAVVRTTVGTPAGRSPAGSSDDLARVRTADTRPPGPAGDTSFRARSAAAADVTAAARGLVPDDAEGGRLRLRVTIAETPKVPCDGGGPEGVSGGVVWDPGAAVLVRAPGSASRDEPELVSERPRIMSLKKEVPEVPVGEGLGVVLGLGVAARVTAPAAHICACF